MIHVDPAHPAFVSLTRQHQAVIYRRMGWTQEAIAEELECSRDAVRYWTDPVYRERQKASARTRIAALRTQRGESK